MKNKLQHPQPLHRTSGLPGWSLLGNQKGDTIIEVLIAMAVISVVLSGAYVLATRSLRGTQVAQMRTQGLKIAQGQTERLKYAARTDGAFDAPGNYRDDNYCITWDSAAGTVARVSNSLPNYAPACVLGEYSINITYDAVILGSSSSTAFGTFSVMAKWDLPGGKSENVTVYYQL